MQTMTYAKRKAARPAKAATATEPWTLDAAPVKADGLALVVAVVLLLYEMIVPTDAAAVLVADVAGAAVTVTTLVMTVGIQVLIKTVDRTGAVVDTGATTTGTEDEATTTMELVLA